MKDNEDFDPDSPATEAVAFNPFDDDDEDDSPATSAVAFNPFEDDDDDEDNATVYVSDGPYAHAYHYDECCYGLSNTSGDIHEMTKWEAEDEGRDECHFCAP